MFIGDDPERIDRTGSVERCHVTGGHVTGRQHVPDCHVMKHHVMNHDEQKNRHDDLPAAVKHIKSSIGQLVSQ